ncbi:MAG: hypothetical protein OSA97_07685, partial [Nevskia sp.]|nr:hypothetical protein [Nevskia sp.]
MSSIANVDNGVLHGRPPQRKPGRPPLNVGVVFSIAFHAVLALYLLHMVRPGLGVLPEKHRLTVVEL